MRSSLLIITAVLSLAGCHAATVKEPATAKFGGSDDLAQINFLDQLSKKTIACHDDAFHGLLLYIDDKDDSADYAGRVAELKRRGLLPSRFDGKSNEAIDRGTLAAMVARILKIKGGVMMQITDGYSRYALRELVFRGVFPPSSSNQTFSGSEFIGIMGRMEDFEEGKIDKPAVPISEMSEVSGR